MDPSTIRNLITEQLGESPSPETMQIIQDFTLLWMFYEGHMFATDYTSKQMEQLVESGHLVLNKLNYHWEYFHQRYIDLNVFSNYFDRLTFSRRSTAERKRLETFLQDPEITDKQRTITLLLIVFRLRNNLFHGIKGRGGSLNGEREVLSRATEVLHDALEKGG